MPEQKSGNSNVPQIPRGLGRVACHATSPFRQGCGRHEFHILFCFPDAPTGLATCARLIPRSTKFLICSKRSVRRRCASAGAFRSPFAVAASRNRSARMCTCQFTHPTARHSNGRVSLWQHDYPRTCKFTSAFWAVRWTWTTLRSRNCHPPKYSVPVGDDEKS
jgi:hypothetical protein